MSPGCGIIARLSIARGGGGPYMQRAPIYRPPPLYRTSRSPAHDRRGQDRLSDYFGADCGGGPRFSQLPVLGTRTAQGGEGFQEGFRWAADLCGQVQPFSAYSRPVASRGTEG